jgi:hypothetical protein
LHGQVPFTHLAVGGPQRRMYDGFGTTGGEQFLLQARTPHWHAFEPPIGPPCREGDIVEVFQRCQPSNHRTNLRGRCPLRRKRSFDLGCRAITAGQSPHGKLQPPVGRQCRLACYSPHHRLIRFLLDADLVRSPLLAFVLGLFFVFHLNHNRLFRRASRQTGLVPQLPFNFTRQRLIAQ